MTNTITTCTEAAIKGDLQALIRLHEAGSPWDIYTCSFAAASGNLDCLRYAHEHGCSWDGHTTNNAAMYGQLDCLKYAFENGCHWNVNVCYMSALGGHIHCLQYAHEHGCPWDQYTAEFAAKNGQLECLKYANEHGCTWDVMGCAELAARFGHVNCFQYAYHVWANTHTFQSFWRARRFLDFAQIVDKINLDDGWWRSALFDIDLSTQPALQQRVNNKKLAIQGEQAKCIEFLSNFVCSDIVEFDVCPYI